ncbi:L,D-transpeptidase family protein [Lapidilactobacillus mulanensis]|uniref:L,D-transpeptidase family protein n=1 Tax=Lapidilactobacillus mulanensis TaxID=2485999 RepID=A0ABW4DSA6_9LACO|nr:L,D-transpeptidase family protein [Lapidilactobacillus mulanensis]
MKKKTKVLTAVLGSLVAVVGAFYVYRGVYYQSHFLPGTSVEGVDLAKLTPTQAKTKLEDQLVNSKYQLYDKKEQLTQVSGKELGVTQNSSQYLDSLMNKQNSWSLATLVKAESVESVALININQTTLDQYVDATLKTLNKDRRESEDAKIIKASDSYQIKDQVQGNVFSKSAVIKTIKQSIANGNQKIQLSTAYEQPKITKTNSKLTAELERIKKLDQITGTYTIAGHTETVTPTMIHQWLSDDNGKISLDQAAMKAYLSSLNDKYATYNKSRSFKSTKRGTVTVPAGIYGWSISTASELPKLTEAIMAGKDFTREPVIVGTGYSKTGYGTGNDIGNTYIEVDIQNQHMWVYIDGQMKIDTDVVTGKPGHDTPVGVWSIWKKERNSVLKGENGDGSNYATKVGYWMPIDETGVGIHDSSWQPQYGGDWYKTHGSHGCINTPPATVAKIFDLVSTGIPVVVF